MEPFEDDPFLIVAEAIADGRAVPWDDVVGRADEESSGEVVRELRLLAALANVHRSGGSESTAVAVPAESLDASETGVPREWGPFQLLEELGRGTFGAVYRCRDVRLDRDVALKLFVPRLGEHAESLTVVSEGRLLARVRHPNVITVYGADVVDGVVGMWMELLRGRTLQQEIDERGPLGPREAALIGIDLCRALATVHRAGLVHRDVKAQNVMREDGGRIVLMDFGAGRDLNVQAGPVTVAGTPLYMAPEVLAGAPATPVSDLYSLGVLLYRLVTNEYPVAAQTLEELERAHATGSRRRLRDVRPDLPATFIRAIEGATAALPGDRPRSAAAFEEQLESVLVSDDAAKRPRRWAIVTTLLTIAIVLGWNGGRIRDWLSPPSPGIRSLAVLPFANLTGQTDQEYLADGVTQILIGNLAQLKSLRVISRTSAMVYKGSNKPLAAIARELSVDGIVEGSVSRSGDRLRVTVQLLRSNEQSVWGQTYERPSADLFKVQGEISSMIAEAVKLSLTPEERRTLTSTPGVEVQAQDLFLRGLNRLNDFRGESLKLALQDLLEAVRLDPKSARAYASLSQCYMLLGTRELLSHDQAYASALSAATRALQLDDSIAEAHTELAEVKFYYEWNWEWARREYERALELNPNNSHALARYSLFLSALDRRDEAVHWATLAQQLDPLSPTVRFAPGMALFYARRYDEAIAAFLHLKEIPPYALVPSDRVGLARSYAARGRYAEAIDEMSGAMQQGGTPPAWMAELGRIHAAAGHRAEALRILRTLQTQADRGGLIAGQIAFIQIALGSRDAAFEALRRAADLRWPALLWINVDPRLDPVRDDARFRELTMRVGLPQ
jgi:serine/threonine protein kinase/tetratricopeptide (TPR) repeat protein